MYGICNSGFKKDNFNIYFSAQDNFSCFFTYSPVSVHVCIIHYFKTIHVDCIFELIHVHTYIYILFGPQYIVYTHTYILFDRHGTLCIPMHTFYLTHTVHIHFLFDPHIHYLYPHGTLISVRTHLRKYEQGITCNTYIHIVWRDMYGKRYIEGKKGRFKKLQ